jgi:hypothetical protein
MGREKRGKKTWRKKKIDCKIGIKGTRKVPGKGRKEEKDKWQGKGGPILA